MDFRMISRSSTSGSFFFYFKPTSGIYTLSLHDALPIYVVLLRPLHELHAHVVHDPVVELDVRVLCGDFPGDVQDRKSTRLNSSHVAISYAVFCLKKKKGACGFAPREARASDRQSPVAYY